MTIKLYNGEVELEFDEAKHLYYANGTLVDLSCSGAPYPLEFSLAAGWAAKMIGEELDKRIIPGKKYTFDEIQKKEFIKTIKGAWRKRRDQAADIGTLVHEFLAEVASGKTPELPVNKKAAKACEEALFWYQETIKEPIAAEAKVYSREHNYAGTLDLDAKTIRGRAIVDWKTGNRVKKYGVKPEHLGQTAGYQNARQEEGYGPYDLRIIVRIDRDTGEIAVHEAWDFERDFESFKAALTLGRFVNAVKATS